MMQIIPEIDPEKEQAHQDRAKNAGALADVQKMYDSLNDIRQRHSSKPFQMISV
jgi:hypothetical protein